MLGLRALQIVKVGCIWHVREERDLETIITVPYRLRMAGINRELP